MLLQEEQYIIHWLTQYGALTKTQVVRLLKDKPPQTAEKIIRGLKREVMLHDISGGYYLGVVLYDGEQHLARLLQPQEDLRYIFVLPRISMAQELVLPNVPCLFATVDYNGQEVPTVKFYTEEGGAQNGSD